VEVDAKLLPGAADVAAVQLAGDKALVPVTLSPYGFAVTNRTHARSHPSSSQAMISHLMLCGGGAAVAHLSAEKASTKEELSVCVGQRDGLTVLENSFVRAVFELSGALVSLIYKPLEREVRLPSTIILVSAFNLPSSSSFACCCCCCVRTLA
jgi:hypothetical protein